MGAPLRVLMIEDSETDVELVVRVLRLGGYDVAYERVDKAAALRAALDRQSWDVVISDHAIPQLSAPAALAVLKKKHPDLPVIVVSDQIDLDLAVALMKAGVHDYVQKGELARLVPAIARELREVEARRKRKQAEEALKESEAKYRTLFETMAQGIVYQDIQGLITYANPAAEKILGLTLDQMQGRTSMAPEWRSIHEDGSAFPGDEHPSMIALETGMEVKNVIMGVYDPQRREHRWINIHATPQFRPGESKPFQVYTTFEDITERQQAETALRENERRFRQLAEENAQLLEQARQDAATKATLLDEVNHRVKNNLASILGILALEAQRPIEDSADYRTALQEIHNRIQGMATVHEMLSATHWSPLPLVHLVERVIHEALSNSPLRQNILVAITPPAEPVLIAPRQATALALIINELTTNSLKHAFVERGRGQIQVHITAEANDGRQVRLEFRNDGPDWPADVLDGQRENVGLRLVRATVRSPLRGELALCCDRGAVTIITFRLAPAAPGPGR